MTVSDDKTLKIWWMNQRKCILSHDLDHRAYALEILPDGTTIAVGGADKKVIFFKLVWLHRTELSKVNGEEMMIL